MLLLLYSGEQKKILATNFISLCLVNCTAKPRAAPEGRWLHQKAEDSDCDYHGCITDVLVKRKKKSKRAKMIELHI